MPLSFIKLSLICHRTGICPSQTARMKTQMTSLQMMNVQQTQTNAPQAGELNSFNGNDVMPLRQKPRLEARFANNDAMVTAAQRLRAEIFGAEYGVKFDALDVDAYDDYCLHLNVYDVANDLLIATTRLLSGEQAALAGGFYSAQEFDLGALKNYSGRILEVGRTCVHPDYRSGAAITVLWSALSDYLMREGFNLLIGCASISLADGGTTLASVMPTLREKHFVGDELRVSPSREILLTATGTGAVSVPPLLKAYLRMGCKIGGEACWDPEFNCADVFIFMDVQAMAGRYAQRFLKTA